jgi:hypothetical protein
MVMNFLSYKFCKFSVCLMWFKMFFVCINRFPKFTPFLLTPSKSAEEGFYCILFPSVQIRLCYQNIHSNCIMFEEYLRACKHGKGHTEW